MIIDKTRQFATDEELQELDKLYQEAHQLEDKFAVTHDIDEEMKNVFINIHTKIDCIEELEAPRLVFNPEEPDDGQGGILGSYMNQWSRMVTQNGI